MVGRGGRRPARLHTRTGGRRRHRTPKRNPRCGRGPGQAGTARRTGDMGGTDVVGAHAGAGCGDPEDAVRPLPHGAARPRRPASCRPHEHPRTARHIHGTPARHAFHPGVRPRGPRAGDGRGAGRPRQRSGGRQPARAKREDPGWDQAPRPLRLLRPSGGLPGPGARTRGLHPRRHRSGERTGPAGPPELRPRAGTPRPERGRRVPGVRRGGRSRLRWHRRGRGHRRRRPRRGASAGPGPRGHPPAPSGLPRR